MKKNIGKLLDDLLAAVPSEDLDKDLEKIARENYENRKSNPENMSFWLPKIEGSATRKDSILKIPETKVIPLPFEWMEWLGSDRYTEEKINEFSDFLNQQLDGFLEGRTLFMKTGIFSNKFDFYQTIVKDRTTIGEQFLSMYYASMMLGADFTSEAVLREMVKDKEDKPVIYSGMPLHTEFRVFYDFDNKVVEGIANYWHPDVMNSSLVSVEDKAIYQSVEKELAEEFNSHKEKIATEVNIFMKGVQGLKGKWSVDVMKNAEDFWLIDMARMERSALVDKLEKVS